MTKLLKILRKINCCCHSKTSHLQTENFREGEKKRTYLATSTAILVIQISSSAREQLRGFNAQQQQQDENSVWGHVWAFKAGTVRPAAAGLCLIHLRACFPINKMLLCRRWYFSFPSGPGRTGAAAELRCDIVFPSWSLICRLSFPNMERRTSATFLSEASLLSCLFFSG